MPIFSRQFLPTLRRALRLPLGGMVVALLAVLPGLVFPVASLGETGNTAGGQGSDQPFVSRRAEPMPREFEGVGVTEKPGVRLPLELTLYNEAGDPVTLAQYVGKGKPVILQLGYFGCPKLCNQIATGTLDALTQVDLTLGQDYSVVYVSIDPEENAAKARQIKQSYIERYTAQGTRSPKVAAQGWHFLTGPKANVRELADTVGFRFKWVESAQQFSHAAVILFIAPDGTVSRYLYGAGFDPKVVRLSLVDASKGKIGSVMDQIIMVCFHFDPNTGQYSLAAMRLMRIAGVASVFGLGAFIAVVAWRGRRLRGITGPGRDAAPRGLSAVLQPSSSTHAP